MTELWIYLGFQICILNIAGFWTCLIPKKVYVRRSNNKVDSTETGRIVIAPSLPWSDLEKCIYITLFWLMMIKFYLHNLIYKYNFASSLFWTTYKLTNNRKTIWILREVSIFRPFHFNYPHPQNSKTGSSW